MAKNKKRKKRKIIQMTTTNPVKYIKKVGRKLPIVATFMSPHHLEFGIGNIFVIREKSNGDKVVGGYLVDSWCLGVKDTFFDIMSTNEYEEFLSDKIQNEILALEETDPVYIFNLIYGSVEYAEDLGIMPHKDFHITQYLLDDVESIDYIDIPFGKDGRPFYTSGLEEDPDKILAILNKTIGEDAYDTEYDINNRYAYEYASEVLDSKNLKEYIAYCDFVDFIWGIANEDANVLRTSLKNYYLDGFWTGLDFSESFEEKINSTEDLKSQLACIVESLIIYDGTDYLWEETLIEAFDKDNVTKYFLLYISYINYFGHGEDKISELIDIVILLLEIGDLDNTEKLIVLRKFYSKVDDFLEDTDSEMQEIASYAIACIRDYELSFGAVDFQKYID